MISPPPPPRVASIDLSEDSLSNNDGSDTSSSTNVANSTPQQSISTSASPIYTFNKKDQVALFYRPVPKLLRGLEGTIVGISKTGDGYIVQIAISNAAGSDKMIVAGGKN